MAISITKSKDSPLTCYGAAQVMKIDWRTEAPNNCVSDTLYLCGLLHGLITKPGTPAPSDGYNVELLNDAGVDMLNSAGLGRDSDATEWAEVLVSSVLPVPVAGEYVFKVSAAGSDTAGTAWLLLKT